MDFFGHQRRARARSTRLVLLLVAAAAAVVLAVNAAAAFAWWLSGGFALRGFPNGFFATNSAITALLVVGGALLQLWSLKDGGPAIASQLGARPLAPASGARDRMLRNVVEEVAIASAMPVPAVYVLEDDAAINALAAGFTPQDAAVVLTSGALARLTREELQGVVAHEFSHVVNGDMRLNTQLVALLYGLELLPHLGRSLMESAFARTRRPLDLALLRGFAALLGLLLLAVGSVGLLAARVIKAAVSREREYLADAHAVQFTRSRDGIGGALRKVLALEARGRGGNRVHGAFAANLSHLFLTAAGERPDAVFASHPPLVERLSRIYGRRVAPLDPQAQEAFPDTAPPELEPLAFDAPAMADAAAGVSDRGAGDALASSVVGAAAIGAANSLPSSWVSSLPSSSASPWSPASPPSPARWPSSASSPPRRHALARLIERCERPIGAQAVLWALLARELTLDGVRVRFGATADSRLVRQIETVLPALAELEREVDTHWRVPLIELACARLARALGALERGVLTRGLRRMIASDRRITVNEWMLLWIVQRRLRVTRSARWSEPRRRLGECGAQVAELTRLLARSEGLGEAEACARALAVLRALGLDEGIAARAAAGGGAVVNDAPMEAVELALQSVDLTLASLAALWPHDKPRLVRAMAQAWRTPAMAGGGTQSAQRGLLPRQRECLRALCSAIDCPPPAELLPAVPVAASAPPSQATGIARRAEPAFL